MTFSPRLTLRVISARASLFCVTQARGASFGLSFIGGQAPITKTTRLVRVWRACCLIAGSCCQAWESPHTTRVGRLAPYDVMRQAPGRIGSVSPPRRHLCGSTGAALGGSW